MLTAGEIAAAVTARDTTAVEQVSAALARLERVEPTLCAFHSVFRETALRQAFEVDRRVQSGAVLPLATEIVHHHDGMTFFSLGPHPGLYAEDGTAVEIFSDYLPETPQGLPIAGFRMIMEAVPPVRSEPDRLN